MKAYDWVPLKQSIYSGSRLFQRRRNRGGKSIFSSPQ